MAYAASTCPFTIEEYPSRAGRRESRNRTFIIREYDRFGEEPFIYAKICEAGDTGAGAGDAGADSNAEHAKWTGGQAGCVNYQSQYEQNVDRSRHCQDGTVCCPSRPGFGTTMAHDHNRDQSTHTTTSRPKCKVIVLSDTGCGTEVAASSHHNDRARGLESYNAGETNEPSTLPSSINEPKIWNLRTFLEHTINPGEEIPYLVMTTHCHYDHILGLGKLPSTRGEEPWEGCTSLQAEGTDKVEANLTSPQRPASTIQQDIKPTHPRVPPTTVLSSSHDKSFITPYSALQHHSLCAALGLQAPHYAVGIWAEDGQQVVYTNPSPETNTITNTDTKGHNNAVNQTTIPTPYTILHTPGHTPDSLSWYDAEERVVCVGDSFYLCDTDLGSSRVRETGAGERLYGSAAPVMFTAESDLADWWASLAKVERFVRERELEHDGGRLGDEDENEAEGKAEDEGRDECHSDEDSVWHMADEYGFTIVKSLPPDPIFTPVVPDPLIDKHPHSPQGIIAGHSHDDHQWLLVDLQPSNPPSLSSFPPSPRPPLTTRPPLHTPSRIRLAASHTTAHAEAVPTILAMRAFMARILRDEVPKTRLESGRWLWDDELDGREDSTGRGGKDGEDGGMGRDGVVQMGRRRTGKTRLFTVVAPMEVVETGRRTIPRHQWSL